jgi:ribulose-5-phosphate 4-epimerase/fuculose-1-phosphate aldolase
MKELISLSHILSRFVVCGEGNISKKTQDGFIIKASGTSLETLSEEDIVSCDFTGKQIDNFSKKPSLETSFHTWLMGFKDINFVAHTHPTNTLKILCSNEIKVFSENRLFPDQVVFNGQKSCVVPYANPGEELSEKIKRYVSEFIEDSGYFPKLILLQNHGIICAGSSSKECIFSTEICEKAAEIYLGTRILSEVINFIDPADVQSILSDKNEIYRKSRIK